MKVLFVISTIISIALCELSEHRNPDGSVTGKYNFIDENDSVHDIEYNIGANLDFQILSHRVSGNHKTFFINNNYTPEVQSAHDSHVALQNYLRMVLPQISNDELPPVYIRHVPKPTKDVHVPIIAVSPPFGAFKRAVKNIHGISSQPQRVVVVNELPPSAQLGGRTLSYDRSPSHIEVKIQEVPLTIGDKAPKALQHNLFESTQQFVPAPHFVEPEIVHHQHVQPQIVHHQPAQQHVQHQIVHHQPAQQHVQPQIVHHQPAQQQVQHQIVHHQPAHQHVQEVSQFVQQRRPIAQDIELVNGFTPEVAKATAEHLSHVAAIKAVLPNIE